MSTDIPPDPRQEPVKLCVMEGYSLWAKSYDTRWNTLIATEELYSLPILDGLDGDTALDVGAGTGRFSLRLARRGWKVTAVDPNADMLSIAERTAVRESLQVGFIHSPIEGGVPVPPSAFDLVVCALTLCHVPDLPGAIREFHRAMAPGGHLLITDVHPDFVAAGMPTQFVEGGVTYHLPNEPHTQEDYLQAVGDAGLNISTVLSIPGREVPGEFETEFMRENFNDVNFALIVLAQKDQDCTSTSPPAVV